MTAVSQACHPRWRCRRSRACRPRHARRLVRCRPRASPRCAFFLLQQRPPCRPAARHLAQTAPSGACHPHRKCRRTRACRSRHSRKPELFRPRAAPGCELLQQPRPPPSHPATRHLAPTAPSGACLPHWRCRHTQACLGLLPRTPARNHRQEAPSCESRLQPQPRRCRPATRHLAPTAPSGACLPHWRCPRIQAYRGHLPRTPARNHRQEALSCEIPQQPQPPHCRPATQGLPTGATFEACRQCCR